MTEGIEAFLKTATQEVGDIDTMQKLYVWVQDQRAHMRQWALVDTVSASHPTVQSFAATLRDTVTRAYDRDWNASRDWPLLHLASISNRALTLYSKLLWVHPTLADTRDSSFFTHSRRTAIHTLVQWLWRYKWEKTYPSEDNEGVKWIQEDLKFSLQDQFRFPAPTARDPTMWSASVRRAYDAVSLPGWYSDKQPRPASTPAPTKKYY